MREVLCARRGEHAHVCEMCVPQSFALLSTRDVGAGRQMSHVHRLTMCDVLSAARHGTHAACEVARGAHVPEDDMDTCLFVRGLRVFFGDRALLSALMCAMRQRRVGDEMVCVAVDVECAQRAEVLLMALPWKLCRVCALPRTASCSRCTGVYYCSAACQLRDWKARHKAECGLAAPRDSGAATSSGTERREAATSVSSPANERG